MRDIVESIAGVVVLLLIFFSGEVGEILSAIAARIRGGK